MKRISFLIITVLISIVSLVPASAFASGGILDQSNGPGTNSSQIDYYEPCGQEFVPTMPVLTGVELYLWSSVNAMGNSTITINIHPSSITEIPIATQSYLIPSNFPSPEAWVYFEFTNPVSVIPGNTYVLEVDSDTYFHVWYTTSNTYSAGNMIKGGITDTSRDWSFRTYGASVTKAFFIDVDIDIKPGSEPNSINMKSKGVIPVAIHGSAGFDVTQIDPETVALEGMMVRSVGKSKKLLAHYEDVNGDGFLDLMVQIEGSDGNMTAGQTEATVTGNLKGEFGGTAFHGSDFINIVKLAS